LPGWVSCSGSLSGGPVGVTLGGRFSDSARAAWPPRRRDAGTALRARLASPPGVRDVVGQQLTPHFDHGREFGGGGPCARTRGRDAVVSGHLLPPSLAQRATYRESTENICACICKNIGTDAMASELSVVCCEPAHNVTDRLRDRSRVQSSGGANRRRRRKCQDASSRHPDPTATTAAMREQTDDQAKRSGTDAFARHRVRSLQISARKSHTGTVPGRH
jgi:hypothetical protein